MRPKPPAVTIAPEDPASPEVRTLLERHLAFCRASSPPEDVHALDVESLRIPSVHFFGCRVAGALCGVGALKELDATHAELKSMHTTEAARGQGLGRAMLQHLLALARARGFSRVSLETGSMAAFAPARALYAGAGFVPCPPFGDYAESPSSTFMTLRLLP